MLIAYVQIGSEAAILYPLSIGAVAIVATIIGLFFIRLGASKNIMGALYKGLLVAGLLSAAAFYPVTQWALGDIDGVNTVNVFWSTIVGLVVTALLVWITEYYTSTKYSPVKNLAQASETGHGTNVIAGLALSMKSTAPPLS